MALLGLFVLLFLGFGYYFYGRRLSRKYSLNDQNLTPAVRFNDGFDFVPTQKPVLFAQHFASIAAAGPVVGPIAATLAFGWGPTLLWIVFGCIFIGACHDFSALVASIRHNAKSIPELAKAFLGVNGYRLSLAFVWLCLIYVIIAFTDVTAQQFIAKEQWGGVTRDIGGGVATSSLIYLVLSIGMGLSTVKLKVPLWVSTILFFPLLVLTILLGQNFPIVFSVENPVKLWGGLILFYCAVASVLPMWLLLQPRGYLGGFFLYTILIIGLLGILFGGFPIQYPAFKTFFSPRGDAMYPFLFITVACGACSGFHGLVCSGTTSKQLQKESHATFVGYGGMLCEALVAVMALTTVIIWPMGSEVLSKSPSEIYSTGIAHFANRVFGLDIQWGLSFGMLAFATFVYDTLDVATRLGRYLMEELFGLKGWLGRLGATGITLLLPLVYVVWTPSLVVAGKTVPLWSSIWPLFGSSNQLLAALTLLLIVIWVIRPSKKPWWIILPAGFMFITAGLALGFQMFQAFSQLKQSFQTAAFLNFTLSFLLLVLSVTFGWLCFRSLKQRL